MKKRKRFSAILMGVAVVGLSAYVGYRTYDAYVEKETESNLLLENAEALADGEGHGERIKCYSSIHYELGSFVVLCSTCKEVEDRTDDLLCFHDYCYR